jgi:hypothetical protein
MKSCPYCGARYADNVAVCPADQHQLTVATESKPETGGSQEICPGCGAVNDYRFTVEPRRSFGLLAILGGGILAYAFLKSGRGRRVRCNKCEAGFYLRSPLSTASMLIFWILVSPTIILLAGWLIYMVVSMYSR